MIRSTVVAITTLALAGTLHAAESPKPADPPLRFETMTHVYRWEQDGTGTHSIHARVRVLNAVGRQALVQIPIPYASASQQARFVTLQVLKRDGSTREANLAAVLDVAHPYTQQAPQYSDLKVKVLPVPAIEVGEALEYRGEIRTTKPISPGQFWGYHGATTQQPVDEEIVVLDLPADRAVAFSHDPAHPPEESREGGRHVRRWKVSNPTVAAKDDDADTPPRSLFMVSTLTTLDALGGWYLDLQMDGSALDDDGKALVARLVAGKSTPREKVTVLHEYVAKSIRYLSLSFGIGGYRPHPVAEVLRNGYGDCKDKDALLRAMLRAAGIESRPVLVNSRWGVLDESVPTPAQFDHVITAAYPEGRPLWLDSTAEVAPPGVISPVLDGKKVAVVAAPGTEIVDVARGDVPPTRKSTSTTGTLDASGALTTTTRHEVQGPDEVRLRMAIRAGAPADRLYTAYLAASYDTAGPGSSEILERGDPTDLSGPFALSFQGKDPAWVPLFETRVARSIPGIPDDPGATFQEEHLAKLDPGKPIRLGRFESEIVSEIAVDPVWDVTLPVGVTVEKSFASWSSSYAFADGKVTARRKLRIALDEVPASLREEVTAFAAVVQRDAAQEAIFRRKSAVNVEAAASSLDADALNTAGLAALDGGRPALAADLLEKAVAKTPDHKFAWNNLGRARMELFDLDGAEKAFLRQIEIVPNDPWAHNNLGRVYAATGRDDEAIAEFRRQIEINPLDAWSYQNLGLALAAKGSFADAAIALARAVELAPEDGTSRAALGVTLVAAGRVDEARPQLERAAELEATPWQRLSQAMELERRGVLPDVAERLARRSMDDAASTTGALEIDEVPDGYFAMVGVLAHGHALLGRLAADQGRLEQATEHLRLAFELNPQPDSGLELSAVLAKRGRYEEALLYFATVDRVLYTPRPEMPAPLRKWTKSQYPDPATLEAKMDELRRKDIDIQSVAPPPGGWKTPKQDPGNQGVEFDARVLVDESGQVVDARVANGREPWAAAALADLKRVRFRPLTGSGRAVRSLREVHFFYLPGPLVRAFWQFSIDPKFRKLVEGGPPPASNSRGSKRVVPRPRN